MRENLTTTAALARLDELYDRVSVYKDSLGYPLNLDLEYLEPLRRFMMFGFNNLGNPFGENNFLLCSWDFEREVLEFLARLYDFPVDVQYHGYIGSGGTESNLHALRLGREAYPEGVLYFSQDSHYSVIKSARLLAMPYQEIATTENGEIDYAALESAIRVNASLPVIVSLNIGTTMKGAIDQVDCVVDILQRLNIDRFYLHCDAALFGMMLPFLPGSPCPSFKQPIHSLTVSGHKFIGSPIPCGMIISRFAPNAQRVDYVNTLDTTISGSRSGHTPLMLWYAIQSKGVEGFRRETQECIDSAVYLHEQLSNMDYPCVLYPFSNIVLLKKPSEELVGKWDLAVEGEWAHIVTMQHVNRERIDRFLVDLRFNR